MDSYRAYTTENLYVYAIFFYYRLSKMCTLAKIIDNGGKKSVFFLKKNKYQFWGNYNCMYKIEYVKHVFKPYHIKLL